MSETIDANVISDVIPDDPNRLLWVEAGILTRDTNRYRTYFPAVELISP